MRVRFEYVGFCAPVVLCSEILGTLTESTPEHHGLCAHASDLPGRLRQHSDMEFSEVATSEAAPEVPPSIVHGGSATN
jgi:hypothetical protein